MELTNEQLFYIERNWKLIPLPLLAQKLKITTIELCIIMREKGMSKDAKDVEILYIIEKLDVGMPPIKIQQELRLTSTQFTQICSRYGLKQKRGLNDMNLDEVIKNTRWLIEQELNLEVDDFLPRKIRQEDFRSNGLSDCLRFASHTKVNDSFYKHFSNVAYLICKTYPDKYRPFQFSHSKRNEYFKGVDGRKNYILALAWVIENKLNLNLKHINILANNNYFLRTKDLNFFGLGIHCYKHHFDGINAIKNELIKRYGKKEERYEHSRSLKQKLESNNIPYNCAVTNCSFQNNSLIEIHHIIPKEHKTYLRNIKIETDDIENLIPLCPNHHAEAQLLIDWKEILKLEPSLWRDTLATQLNEI